MTKKCLGCGATLQSSDNTKMGYIKEDIILKANYCERCFKITHYNENLIMPLDNINDTLIKEVNKKAKYVFFLVDFLNLSQEIIDTYEMIKCPKTLIISKLDIIPKSIKTRNIKEAIKRIYNVREDIIFISSKNKTNMRLIYKILDDFKCKEAYLLGYTNAGKSTLINNLCIDNNLANNIITTSLIPNTTLDFIKIKLNEELTIIDSPGFMLNNNLYELNDFNLIKKVVPKVFLKPRTYQLKENCGIVIENKYFIYTDKGNSFTCYFSNQVEIGKVFKKELDFTSITCHENSDLIIKSLGFINIKQECEIKICNLDLNLIEIRDSIFRK